MKCPSCGNGLHMEDEKCPYCGKENPYYKKHRLAMRKYQKDYNDVKEDVYKKTGSFTGMHTKITAIAVLAVLNMELFLLGKNAWDIHYLWEEKQINRHSAEHVAVIDRLETEKDYFALGTYWDKVYLYGSTYNEYYQICWMSHYYIRVYAQLMDLTNEDTYTSIEEKIKNLCSDIEYMYEFSVQEEYDDPSCFSERHLQAMDDIKEELKCLLITYCNLTEAEAEEFPGYSNGQKQLVLERGIKKNAE